MPEGIITTAQNALAIATVVAARALPPLKANTVAYSVSDPSYSNEVARFGNRVNVPIPAEFTSNLMADGGTISRQNPSLGNAALILDRHREITWEHTDVNRAFATPDLQGTSLGQAIANLAEDIDADFLGIYSQFTTTDVGTYNTALTEPVIDSAETTLFNQRVPSAARKSLIVNGSGYSQLRQIPRFSEADKRPGAVAGNARIMGQLKDFDVYRAQKISTTSGTDTHGIAMSPAALLTAVRRLGQTGMGTVVQVELEEDGMVIRFTWSYHQEVLGGLSTLDVLYGFVAGRTNHGVEVRN